MQQDVACSILFMGVIPGDYFDGVYQMGDV